MTPGDPKSAGRVPLDTEAARAFYQERLALFAKNCALIVFVFWCFANALPALYGRPPSLGFVVGSPSNRMLLLADAIVAGVWLATRRGTRAPRALLALDAGGIVLSTWAFVGMGPALAMAGARQRTELLLLLILFTMHWLRAVLVPSSARLSLALAAASAAPLLALSWAIGARTLPGPGVLVNVAYVGLWCGVLVTAAGLTSRVIYGLREQVREAKTLGQYTLVRKIGQGGMGAVYRARHAMLRRPTAVKLLEPSQAGEANLARFEREVQLTSRLTHPNTVAIYDYGRTPDGVFYYAMEYLDGLDLQDVVELDGPQDPSRVVHVLAQVCAALAEAHGIGLVHRDVKPANVLLCERGGVPDVAKVVDFGLVKKLERDAADASVDRTGVGTILGTPLYMSPEAILTPDAIDARSDLYAVGALGYFLLTGAPVFEGATVIEVCSRHIHAEPVRPSERLGRALPHELEAVILRCLAKDPAARHADAASLREALVACEVPPWTSEQAREWWSRVAPDGARRARRDARKRTDSKTVLTVDLRAREPRDGRPAS